MDFKKLRTVKQLAEESGGLFSEGALRWKIFNAATLGLDSALVHVGRRVYIDTDEFNRWLDRQRVSQG